MGGWFYNLKEIFVNEAGGVAGECALAFKEAFMQRGAHGQLRTTCTCASTLILKAAQKPVSAGMS